MRFSCEVEVYNRICASTAQPQSKRQKSTLTIGGYESSHSGGKLWILHQTAHNGMGVRYKVNSNISGLFAKFVHEGKATVRFIKPAVDLRIMGDSKLLSQFVELIRSFCTGKPLDTVKKIKLTNLETAAKKCEAPPQKKLVISTSKDLRSCKGSYPSTLENLQINAVGLTNVDPKIFRLQHLKILNLEGNQIQRVPKSIDLISGLCELNLARNKMGLSVREEDWEWLRCESLRASLRVLDLSNNEILAIPNCLPHLRTLKTLYLNDNKLRKLPNNIGLAKNLKNLVVNRNNLEWLPASLLTCHLENCDVSDNQFLEVEDNPKEVPAGICLKDMAARAVLVHRLKYKDSELPRELIRYLESACFCLCGKATFPSEPSVYHSVCVRNLASSVVYDGSHLVTMGFRKCLVKCRSK
uniref:Leucine-rich repeat protein 1 n=1 Tax=Lygus hesperus TaxID=30085 RepID=A0A146KPM5_LYGHE